jgi:hypothetical protein
MRHLVTTARVALGLGFTLFSLNYFVPFLPPQGPPPPEALGFLGAFAGSGMLALVKALELAAGVALLSNRFVPLALAVLAPILVGIAAFHVLLAPAGLALVVGLLGLELFLAWAYRASFAPMLHARTAATASGPAPALVHAAPARA